MAAGFTVTTMSAQVNKWCNTVSTMPGERGRHQTCRLYRRLVFRAQFDVSGIEFLGHHLALVDCGLPDSNPQNRRPEAVRILGPPGILAVRRHQLVRRRLRRLQRTAAGLAAYIVGNVGLPAISSHPSSRTADRGGSIIMTTTASGTTPFALSMAF